MHFIISGFTSIWVYFVVIYFIDTLGGRHCIRLFVSSFTMPSGAVPWRSCRAALLFFAGCASDFGFPSLRKGGGRERRIATHANEAMRTAGGGT